MGLFTIKNPKAKEIRQNDSFEEKVKSQQAQEEKELFSENPQTQENKDEI